MIIKLQSGDKIKIESDEKREARRKYKEHSQLSIGQKLKRNLNIASNFLKSGPNITNFGNAVSALFGGYSPEDPDLHYGEAPGVGIKNFENLVRTARVAREFNDVVKGPVNQFRLLNNFIEKFVTNPKGSGKLVHYDKGNGKSVFQENRGASIINGKLIPGKTKREGQKNYTWWNTDSPYINVHKAKEGPLSPTRYIVVDNNSQFIHPFDIKGSVGQSAGKGRGFILPTERVTDKPVDLTNAEIYEKSPFGWWEKIKVQPVPKITKNKQSRLISPGTYPWYRGPRFDINEIVNSNGTINPRKAMQVQHTVAKQFGKRAHKMEHRLEDLEWHEGDPNTYEHTKRVAQSAWEIPTPEGYTKQDQMIAALGHDFGKIISGDGHAQIGADLAKQVFPNLTGAQYTAIAEHMGSPKTLLGKATKLADIRNGIVVRNINGKTRIQLPTHTEVKPREIVIDPQGNNKYYIHMRVWNDVENHIPGSINNVEKSNLFQTLYETLPNGAEILFPKSGPGNYGTRGTVAGLMRLSKDPRFTPGTKGTLQYLDKDGKTIKTYEGTSFIKEAIDDSKPNVYVMDNFKWKELSYPSYINYVWNNLKAKGIKTEPYSRSNTNEQTHMNFFNKGFNPVFKIYPQDNLKAHAQEILRRMRNFGLDVDNTMGELPLYGKKSIKDLVTLNAGRTSYVGYYNKSGVTGTFFHNNGTSIVDPGYPEDGVSPLQSIATTMHHERNMHGTQKFLTPGMWKLYEDFLSKMIKNVRLDKDAIGNSKIYIKHSDGIETPIDKGSLKKEELRATLGEIIKNLYDNQAYRRALGQNPNVKRYELEAIRPYFEQVVDEMSDEQLNHMLGTINGYGADYAEIGPKENPDFYKELRNLLKVAPASLLFLIPRKEEKK